MKRLLPLLFCAAAAAMPAPQTLPNPIAISLRRTLHDNALNDGSYGAVVVAVGRRSPEAIQAGTFGVVPYDGGEQRELFAENGAKLLAPASNLKLFTTAAALDVLGPDHTFTTRVAADEPPAAGTVRQLYLIGGGDPSLDYDGLKSLAEAVAARGVTKVGRVIGDTSRYQDRYGNGWAVDDLPWYYAAEVIALTLARNHVDVWVGPGPSEGAPAKVWCSPANDYVVFDSTVTTGAAGSRTSVSFDKRPGRRPFILRGRIALDKKPNLTEGMAIEDVELYAAHVFGKLLEQAGVTVEEAAGTGTAPGAATELASLTSPPLSELLVRLLKRSDNLYAELLLREIGLATTGTGSAAGGLHGVRAFLQKIGVDPDPLRLADGSGLSRYNLITARTVSDVLRAMAYHPAREVYFHALPIAGVDGTLARRMQGTAAEGNVRAKTGYYSQHTSLSGYVTTADRDLLAAATIFNHSAAPTRTLRDLHDAFFAALAASRRS